MYGFYCQLADDRMALVSGISLDPEAAVGVTKRLPPKWVDGVVEVRNMLLTTSVWEVFIIMFITSLFSKQQTSNA